MTHVTMLITHSPLPSTLLLVYQRVRLLMSRRKEVWIGDTKTDENCVVRDVNPSPLPTTEMFCSHTLVSASPPLILVSVLNRSLADN